MNLKTEDAIFKLHQGRLNVNGSFITEVHLVAREQLRVPGRQQTVEGWAYASYWAADLYENYHGQKVINGSCGGRYFKLGRGGTKVSGLAVQRNLIAPLPPPPPVSVCRARRSGTTRLRVGPACLS